MTCEFLYAVKNNTMRLHCDDRRSTQRKQGCKLDRLGLGTSRLDSTDGFGTHVQALQRPVPRILRHSRSAHHDSKSNAAWCTPSAHSKVCVSHQPD